MPSFALPAVPAGARLEVLEVGTAPLVRRLLDRLDLPGLLQRHLPRLPGPQPELPTATVLALLPTHPPPAPPPLFAHPAWARSFVPEPLGLPPGQAALLNDGRCGRSLDPLPKADRASLVAALALEVIRVFRLGLSQ